MTADAPAGRSPGRPLGLVLAVAALVLLADQATKHWAVNALSDGRTIDLFWTLRFRLAFNTGMSFSRGTGMGSVITVVALVVLAVLVRWAVKQPGGRFQSVVLGVVMGGVAGNVTDRLFRDEGWGRGAVVDFIDPQWWPIFNIADTAIVLGGLTLVLLASRAPVSPGEPDTPGRQTP